MDFAELHDTPGRMQEKGVIAVSVRSDGGRRKGKEEGGKGKRREGKREGETMWKYENSSLDNFVERCML